MSANFLQGFLGTQQAGIEARNDITVAVRNWFANRNPLVTRLPYVPVERVDFLMYSHQYRNRSTTLGVAISASTTTGLTLGDCDVPDEPRRARAGRLPTGRRERVQINGDPTSTQHDHRAARRRRHDGDDLARRPRPSVNLIGNSPDRCRGQSDRPDHDRRSAGRSIARPSSSRSRSAARPRRPGPR